MQITITVTKGTTFTDILLEFDAIVNTVSKRDVINKRWPNYIVFVCRENGWTIDDKEL